MQGYYHLARHKLFHAFHQSIVKSEEELKSKHLYEIEIDLSGINFTSVAFSKKKVQIQRKKNHHLASHKLIHAFYQSVVKSEVSSWFKHHRRTEFDLIGLNYMRFPQCTGC